MTTELENVKKKKKAIPSLNTPQQYITVKLVIQILPVLLFSLSLSINIAENKLLQLL